MSKPKSSKPKLNADAAYENAHLVAYDLLQRIDELLQDLPHPDNHAIHWGHVGNLAHVNDLLARVVRFLDGTGE